MLGCDFGRGYSLGMLSTTSMPLKHVENSALMSAVTSSELPGREGTDLSLDVQGLALRVDGFWGLGLVRRDCRIMAPKHLCLRLLEFRAYSRLQLEDVCDHAAAWYTSW